MTSRNMLRVVFWAYAIAWTVMLLVPEPAKLFVVREVMPKAVISAAPSWDKVVHLSGYFGLALLALGSYAARPNASRLGWLCVACVAHGALTELGQTQVPSRQGDVADWIADTVGVMLAGVLFVLLRRNSDATRDKSEGSPQQPRPDPN